MGVQSLDGEHATNLSDLLAISFGTTVAMWAVGYVGYMPLIKASPLLVASLVLLCLVGGGWTIVRRTHRGVRGGLGLGLIVALLNLQILGSLLVDSNTRQIVPRAWIYVLGYFVVCLALAFAGAVAGSVFPSKSDRSAPVKAVGAGGSASPDWLVVFAWTACLTMLLLIAVGGLVTGFRAGMAVKDWPNTDRSLMFLFPLAEMIGGVFYEHAHRLVGFLVGVTTLVLAVLISIRRRSIGATLLIWTVGTFVGLQGVMGGLRVTDNNTYLAVLHGFFAHVILAGMVGVAVLLAYPRRPAAMSFITAEGDENASLPNETDGFLATLLVAAILGQTLLGTLVRQMDVGLIPHLSMAMLVAMLAILVGVRLWGLYPQIAVFARGGLALMGVVILQLFLGGISLVFRTPPAAASPSAEQLQAQANALRPATHAILTTAHQTTAAVLLAIAALLAFWTWRFVIMRVSVAAADAPVVNAETAATAR